MNKIYWIKCFVINLIGQKSKVLMIKNKFTNVIERCETEKFAYLKRNNEVKKERSINIGLLIKL